MKAVTSLWASTNTYATNSSGFSGLPGGYRNGNGTYLNIGLYGFWWSSAQYTPTDAWDRKGYVSGLVDRGNDVKRLGFSVRCVRD